MPRHRAAPPNRRKPKVAAVDRPVREDVVRAAALECLGAILQESHLADRALERVLRRETRLYSNERRAVAERVYAVLRRLATFDFVIDGALRSSRDPLTSGERDALRLALVRLAEGESKERVQADSGLRVGHRAVLEAWADVDARLAQLPALARLRYTGSLPEFLAATLLKQMTLDEALALMAALNQRAPLTARANLLRTTRDALVATLAREGAPGHPTPYSPWGIHLDTRQNAFALEAFRRGELELQDEGSQLLALAVSAKPRERVADACAGAGGKTLALAAAMKNQGEILALDADGKRLADAKPRARRAGVSIVRTRQIPKDDTAVAAIADIAGRMDRVLVDAPCSGLGALRRNPDARWRMKPADLEFFPALQSTLLARFAPLARPGGLVLYATCSVLRQENEEVVERFLAATPSFEPVPVSSLLAGQVGDLQVGAHLRLWPHQHGTDGFFAAAFRRRS